MDYTTHLQHYLHCALTWWQMTFVLGGVSIIEICHQLYVIVNRWMGGGGLWTQYNLHLSVAAVGMCSSWTFRAKRALCTRGNKAAVVGIACSVKKAQTQWLINCWGNLPQFYCSWIWISLNFVITVLVYIYSACMEDYPLPLKTSNAYIKTN